jgi:osmoprotectant transport system ATP-binding protein
MDEPFGSLDPLQKSRHQQALLDIQAQVKKTILLVTHDMDEAILLADRILVMNRGELIQDDTPENLLRCPKDDFVRNFVGTDRSLKRLIRRRISEVVKTAFPWAPGMPWAAEDLPWSWVVDAQGVPKGWITREQALAGGAGPSWSPLPESAAGIGVNTNLKDVLSLMLATGMKVLPVTDSQGRLEGEVSMDAVETLTREDLS